MADVRWCDDPGEGAGAVRTQFVRNEAKNLTRLSFICRPGLDLDRGSLQIQCAPPGNWSNTPPTCVEPQDSNYKAYVIGGSVAAVCLVLLFPLLIDFIRFQRKRAKIKENTQRKFKPQIDGSADRLQRSRPSVFFNHNLEPTSLLAVNSAKALGSNESVAGTTGNGHVNGDVATVANEKPKKKKKIVKGEKKKRKKKKEDAEEGRASGLESSMDDGGFKSSRKTKRHLGKRVTPVDQNDDMGEYLAEVTQRSNGPETALRGHTSGFADIATGQKSPSPLQQLQQGFVPTEQSQYYPAHTSRTADQYHIPEAALYRHPQYPTEFPPPPPHGGSVVQLTQDSGQVYQVPSPRHPSPRQLPIQPTDPRLYPSQQLHPEGGAFPDTLNAETEDAPECNPTSARRESRPLPPRPAQATQGSTNMMFKSSPRRH